MPETDLALLVEAAQEAGRIARTYSGATAQSWEKPDNAGPVTECDLAVNRMLEERLRAARPDYGWLSEESEDNEARLEAETVFVIDPLDGTRSFMEGGRTFAHALAVVRNGLVQAGVVYLPLLDKLYTATYGGGAKLNGTPIKTALKPGLDRATVLAAKPVLQPRFWKGGVVPDIDRVYRPSLAYRLCLVAEGRYDAMITLRDSWEWDIAAGALIMAEAGAVVTDRYGAPLRFNNARPKVAGVLAASRAVHAEMRAALA
ncbi:3'(2'),5'-bisphosphate nucleotidase CysQ [Rhodalgimonas zhirmunskyi]|uniref:3'(2'),5'-bisphosphate nucleotidase CysQ n=1 Tax=Rhodalgimonas zhirmunskyi TaxID=2964767 RepID=A0AAJ1U6I8_9RHOB|nr:3'(2'),5'-bisphosphate nucleotidase CysQ [Rhodoalgimonas zhirmunskyi]MDQ2094525.1 3'(2'),5'-bisphosphate nucleotidase CysQ [Rhodoalgimonas zhirmunskyi]